MNSLSWKFLTSKPSYLTENIGILPDILNTIYIIFATLLIVLPLGVGAAVYLTEYASNKRIVGIIEYAAETLSGIPSIIYGLVGMLLFSNNMGKCLLAGALTLVIMNLPTIMRTTQESLKTVPQSYREGAFGLGAGKWRVVRTVVLPGCVDGVITGVGMDGELHQLNNNAYASMNMWGFTPDVFVEGNKMFADFLTENANELKKEFYIPFIVNTMINNGKASVKVLSSPDKWFGVTYKEDRPTVIEKLREMTESGLYPSPLF